MTCGIKFDIILNKDTMKGKYFMNDTELKKALIIGITSGRKDEPYSDEKTVNELKQLAETAGAEVYACILQPKDFPDNATYLGKGKLEEAAELCRNAEIELVIADDELSGSQQRNIEDILNVHVIDRTTLILDIFALGAVSSEGKLQVQLAQYNYFLPRLSGIGASLSRLGGGIGTRGPGETKLETDRRHIRSLITHLKAELKEVGKRRNFIRERRKKDGRLSVAVVGYTNAGKSTLLNYYTNAGVLAENKLFATLDSTARGLTLPDGREVTLIDTVGFIRKLPHHLVEAFKSTLEEAVYADVILNVVDFSDEYAEDHKKVSDGILNDLGCENTPRIYVYNKCDAVGEVPKSSENEIYVSAKTGYNMENLLKLIAITLPKTKIRMDIVIPYSEGGLAGDIRNDAIIISEEYVADGIRYLADIDKKAVYKYERFKT